ncbi:N-acetylmuramoyl-L-alanine amidase [Oleisolibacter albus]|uniref:N-acetylmuramoyl-L-alanine amidase n=1 Tax=Oleisolibacter albus TaxID=2171757 RepID=UPI000DF47665|nr:N-acetylmuramoyl-L-alanine amidase [Oleisolibacter albus]
MRLIDLPSPNHGPRPDGVRPDLLLLHYTGMPTAAAALERLCDPEAQVSAHYLIDEDGTLYRLVHEGRRAWHAGLSCWQGVSDINGRSIGIELVNPGHEFGYRPFPAAQMHSLLALAAALVRDWSIPPLRVLGHSDVAPARKQDPGELFDWAGLARAGIGAWPAPSAADDGPWSDEEVRRLLARIGYGTAWDAADGTPWAGGHGTAWDGLAGLTLLAFQRHWHPAALTGRPDAETVRRLRALVRCHATEPLASAGPGV